MAENAPEDDDQMFSQLVEGVVTKAQTETKCESSDKLRDVIRLHIHTWLYEVEDINPLYKVSELIPVGSYAEGTKIIQPDEFDYLAVIEEFSKPNVIAIDADNSNIREGLVKVVVEDEELKSKCSGLCKDGHLKCFQPINFPMLREKRFGHVLVEFLWTFVRRSKRFGPTTGSPTDIDCKILLPTVDDVSLYFTGADFKAPNVLIKFEYQSMKVTVDVSPAIRYYDIQSCFNEKDCAGPAFADLVLKRSSLLFVGTLYESDFKVTVTEAEVEYIQKVMKLEHKIIYIFLKYITKLYKDKAHVFLTFTSYMIKTVCIHHDMGCGKSRRSILNCYKSVVNDLNVCANNVESIVNKHIRLGLTHYDKNHGDCLLQGMRKMTQLPTDIKTVKDFDSFLKRIVKNDWQKRSKAAQEEDELNTEHQESFRAELKERVSHIVDMGFEPEEVKKVMENTLYDSELAIRILLQRRDESTEKHSSNEVFMTNYQAHSDSQKYFDGGTSDSSKFRDENAPSENVAQTHDVTYEILYQRQKDY